MASFNEARRLGIGGSDVAAIMGLSPWGTPLKVYLQKVRGDITEDKPDLVRGRRAEKYALEQYADEHGVELDTKLSAVHHPEFVFLIGNIDAIIKNTNILIEAKTAKCYPWDGLPIYYRTQVAHYAMIIDCDYVDIPVIFSKWEYQCYRYNRDLVFEKKIRDACISFWENHVLKNIPPQMENSDDARSLFSISTEKSQKATETTKKTVEELQKVLSLIKRLKKKEDELKLLIMTEMQDAQVLLSDDDTPLVTWKSQTRKGIDVTLLKKERSDIYNEFSKDITSRPFKIKEK